MRLTIVVFGITSNLCQKKLIPALANLLKAGILNDEFQLIGLASRERSEEEIKELFGGNNDLLSRTNFLYGDFADRKVYEKLRERLNKNSNVIFDLATLPNLYQEIFENLKLANLNEEKGGFVRLMIEKPFGEDEMTAKRLNKLIKQYFHEEQVYRIDHYLAKETIQNLITFRFKNPIISKMLSWKNVDHIQITAAETLGVEMRGSYYDTVGALKDVGQNHLLQMLAFCVMDEPKSWDREGIIKERKKVFEALKIFPETLVLGQYEGYLGEKKNTNTFFAFKTELSKGVMKGVPVYLRGGKRLPMSAAEISIIFKSKPGEIKNILTFRIQPNEGVVLHLAVKKPGFERDCEETKMQFCYKHLKTEMVGAYEKLIVETIRGDSTFFNEAEEVELQWHFIDGLKPEENKVLIYQSGTWGPSRANELIEIDGRKWIEPSENICKN